MSVCWWFLTACLKDAAFVQCINVSYEGVTLLCEAANLFVPLAAQTSRSITV